MRSTDGSAESRLGTLICGAALLVPVACSTSPSVPSEPPTLIGDIVARTTPGDRWTIHVKESPDDACGIVFTILPETELLRRASGAWASAPADSLVPGRQVRVWSGPVAESCPAQSRATTVALLPAGG